MLRALKLLVAMSFLCWGCGESSSGAGTPSAEDGSESVDVDGGMASDMGGTSSQGGTDSPTDPTSRPDMMIPAVFGTCEMPEAFVPGKIHRGTTRGAPSNISGSSCGNGGVSPESVFSFVAEQSGPICISTERSNYDTVLFVRATNCEDPEAEVACNDTDRTFTGGDQSALDFEMVEGTEYYVFVDGFGSIGNFYLSASYGRCADVRPVTCNAEFPCGDGTECDEGRCIRRCEADEDCPDPRSICSDAICLAVECRNDGQCGDGFCEENTCQECRTTNDCSGTDQCFNGECVGCLEDSDCDSNVCESNECVECRADTQCESNAAEPFCAEFSCVECTTDDHCPSVLGGDQNYCESYRCVECREDAQCADGLSCVSNVCVERARNVTCSAPNSYEIGQVILGDLAGHVGSYDGSCTGFGSEDRPETVFELVATTSATACFSLKDSDFDTLMYARRAPSTCTETGDNSCESFCANGDEAFEVDCNDDSAGIAGGTRSAIEIDMVEGEHYFIFVDRYGSQSEQSNTAFKLASSLGSCQAQLPPECDDTGDCAIGLECLQEFCTVRCDDATPCPDRLQACDQEICKPVACIEDDDCGFFESCSIAENALQNRCVDCASDDDCFSGVCVDELCVDCRVDANCVEGSSLSGEFFCSENECKECAIDEHCPIGYCGARNNCVECTADEQCGSGACVSESCVECREDDQCAAGFGCGADYQCNECAADTDCAEGVCNESGECVVCTEDSDCSAGFGCREDQTCNECAEDTDCTDGVCATGGVCVGCVENDDCGENESCRDNSCVPFVPSTGGTCDAAQVYTIGTEVQGSTEDLSSTHTPNLELDDGCDGNEGRGPEAVFSVTPTEDAFVCFATDNSAFDSVLYIRGGTECGNNENDIFCDDDAGEGTRSLAGANLLANETYFVFVDGFSDSSAGDFVLSSYIGVDGSCEIPETCTTTADCDAGEICQDSACIEACLGSSECEFGELCLDEEGSEVTDTTGKCTEIECRNDVHCGSRFCLGNECVGCLTDDNCAYDEICAETNECVRTNLCYAPNEGSQGVCDPAGDGSECGPQETCGDAGACERTYECNPTLDETTGEPLIACAAHEVCNTVEENGVTSYRCEFVGGCRAQEVCEFAEGAEPEDAGECLVVDCLVNSDCFSFRPYCTNRYQCVECTLDEHCGDAEACINDMCIFEPECGAADLPECPEGSECFTGFCAEPAGTCDEPEVLAIGVVNGNTSGGLMTHDSAECGFGSDKGRGPEAVYVFTPEADGEYCIDTEGSSIDTVLYVRAGDCTDGSDAAQLTCDDDGGESTTSSTSFQGMEGIDYYVFVDTYSTNAGPYTLNIRRCP